MASFEGRRSLTLLSLSGQGISFTLAAASKKKKKKKNGLNKHLSRKTLLSNICELFSDVKVFVFVCSFFIYIFFDGDSGGGLGMKDGVACPIFHFKWKEGGVNVPVFVLLLQ